MYYTGIGSRRTPERVGVFMTALASRFSELGYTLRSGAADGADTYFERGALRKEIYLPWRGFNNHPGGRTEVCDAAMTVASYHHPAWERLSQPVRKLMARNVYQILGDTLDQPSEFVVCWTADGCESWNTRTDKTGGTGLAISLASCIGIPVYNLHNPSSRETVRDMVFKRLWQMHNRD